MRVTRKGNDYVTISIDAYDITIASVNGKLDMLGWKSYAGIPPSNVRHRAYRVAGAVLKDVIQYQRNRGTTVPKEEIDTEYKYCGIRGYANCRACSDPHCNLRIAEPD